MEKTAGQVFAERMGEALKSRGMNKADLARRLVELGHRIDPVVLGRIAKGGTRAANISVEDMLAIAYALDAPPMRLLQPYDDETTVKVVGNRDAVTPKQMFLWMLGHEELPGMDKTTFLLELPPEQLVRAAEGYRMRAIDAQLLDLPTKKEES